MNKRLTHSIDLFCTIAEYLNKEIETNGEIQKNNHDLWNNFLHKFTNDDWHDLYLVITTLSDTKYIKGEHIELFDEILDQIHRLGDYYENVMDLRKRGYINNKPTAWKAIHSVREIYNEICEIYLPNSDDSKLTHKDALFQIGD